MRKKRLILYFAFVLFSGLLPLFIFVNLSSTNDGPLQSVNDLDKRLNDLNAEISAQREHSDRLIEKLRRLTGDKILAPSISETPDGVIGVLVMSCNRPSVGRHIEQLLRFRPSAHQFPIVVSQDCGDAATANVIQSYTDQLTHITQPDKTAIAVPTAEKRMTGYYHISRHYRWALEQMFETFGLQQVLVMEDDLDVSPDVFHYFRAALPLLRADQQTLWCVSAWNDNGKSGLIDTSRADLLYRTDFFPGLGWMLTRQLWLELRDKWPQAYWDDWMRRPEQRLGRQCIRPEVSRTRTFGKKGVSNGLFFEKHLKFIELNQKFVDFTALNLSYLQHDNYQHFYTDLVYSCREMDAASLKQYAGSGSSRNKSRDARSCVRLTYTSKVRFKYLAKLLGLMDDFKAGVPRGSYRGIISTMFAGVRVYLSPPPNWTGYDPSWS